TAAVIDGAEDPLAAFVDWYVSPEHRDNPASGCGVVALGADASRADPRVRAAYTEQVKRYLAQLEQLLGWPGGPVYVAIAGVLLLGAGVYQGYKGIARKFLEDSQTQRMGAEVRRTFTALGVAGYCARGVTFLLIGYGLIKAAVDYSPRSAVGLDGALQELIHASYGPLLLGVVAAGFLAFALFSIAGG